MQFSVIICTFQRANFLKNTLQTIVNQSFSPDEYEIIVADNNSGDGTADVVQFFQQNYLKHSVRYCLEKQQGGSFARNAGAKMALGKVLVFFDDDVLVEPNYLSQAAIFFKQNAAAAAVGGKILVKYLPNADAAPKWMTRWTKSLAGEFDLGNTSKLLPKKFPFEANVAYQKADFDRVGGFDGNIAGVIDEKRYSGEGKDLIFRLRNAGGKIYYEPQMSVLHCVDAAQLTARFDQITLGIGRGEAVRIQKLPNKRYQFAKKYIEYFAKLLFVVALAPAFTQPQRKYLIRFRKNALRGLYDL